MKPDRKVEWECPSPPGPGGRIWFGRNGREHGGEFYLGIMEYDAESIRIPDAERRKVARLLRRFANRLDPPSKKEGGAK